MNAKLASSRFQFDCLWGKCCPSDQHTRGFRALQGDVCGGGVFPQEACVCIQHGGQHDGGWRHWALKRQMVFLTPTFFLGTFSSSRLSRGDCLSDLLPLMCGCSSLVQQLIATLSWIFGKMNSEGLNTKYQGEHNHGAALITSIKESELMPKKENWCTFQNYTTWFQEYIIRSTPIIPSEIVSRVSKKRWAAS